MFLRTFGLWVSLQRVAEVKKNTRVDKYKGVREGRQCNGNPFIELCNDGKHVGRTQIPDIYSPSLSKETKIRVATCLVYLFFSQAPNTPPPILPLFLFINSSPKKPLYFQPCPALPCTCASVSDHPSF